MRITSCDCFEKVSEHKISCVKPFLLQDSVIYKPYSIFKTKGINNPESVEIPIRYCPFCGKEIEIEK